MNKQDFDWNLFAAGVGFGLFILSVFAVCAWLWWSSSPRDPKL